MELARQYHNTSPVATAALGRLLTAGAMMGAMMKGEKDLSLTLQVKGNGPLGGITVTADSAANVKGYVNNPEVLIHANEKGKLDVGGAVGAGILNVIRDMGLKEPSVGQCEAAEPERSEMIWHLIILQHRSRCRPLLVSVSSWIKAIRCDRQADSSFS